MNRQIANMLVDGVKPEKISKACDYIFEYLNIEEFSSVETEHLISSMRYIISKMQERDPLRKLSGFDYSSSADALFASEADLKAKS